MWGGTQVVWLRVRMGLRLFLISAPEPTTRLSSRKQLRLVRVGGLSLCGEREPCSGFSRQGVLKFFNNIAIYEGWLFGISGFVRSQAFDTRRIRG